VFYIENDDLHAKFIDNMAKYGKSYATQKEHLFRLQIFEETDDFIQEWNSNNNNTSKVSHNMFSDMTDDEKDVYTGFEPTDLTGDYSWSTAHAYYKLGSTA
jgi:hypothetical protein